MLAVVVGAAPGDGVEGARAAPDASASLPDVFDVTQEVEICDLDGDSNTDAVLFGNTAGRSWLYVRTGPYGVSP